MGPSFKALDIRLHPHPSATVYVIFRNLIIFYFKTRGINFDKFKLRGLRDKYAVATWNL